MILIFPEKMSELDEQLSGKTSETCHSAYACRATSLRLCAVAVWHPARPNGIMFVRKP
jgi:hypothetical protein